MKRRTFLAAVAAIPIIGGPLAKVMGYRHQKPLRWERGEKLPCGVWLHGIIENGADGGHSWIVEEYWLDLQASPDCMEQCWGKPPWEKPQYSDQTREADVSTYGWQPSLTEAQRAVAGEWERVRQEWASYPRPLAGPPSKHGVNRTVGMRQVVEDYVTRIFKEAGGEPSKCL